MLYLGIIKRINNKGYIMSVTEKLMEAIDEVLNEKEKEVIISFLDSADEIDFGDFWRKKNYKVIAEKGLTTYWTKPLRCVTYNGKWEWDGAKKKRINDITIFDTGFRSVSDTTVYERLKSAMEKLEKSPKLRVVANAL
jgi:hypothetical protein